MNHRLAKAAVTIALFCAGQAAAAPVTTSSLLSEMTDLAGLSEFPNPSYISLQASSHDPKSVSPSDADGWFANEDFGHFLRTEQTEGRTEHVMMEAAGPGAIVRIWSANPDGTLRIYLDGAAKPVIEAKMADLLGGKLPGLARPISGEYAKGWNLYLPIAYAKSCKVTTDVGKFYYAVDYRTYAQGTDVTTFKFDDLKTLAAEVTKQNERLDDPKQVVPAGGARKPFEVSLAPGTSKRLELNGAAAISALRVHFTEKPTDQALRSIVVQCVFDGEQTVEVPLGDFFGTTPGFNDNQTLPLDVSKDGAMTSRWFMPFAESATILVKNLGDTDVVFDGELETVAHTWTDASMHFHAGFRSAYDMATRPIFDWTYLNAKGKGVFAGVAFGIDNPAKAWWGEGDEKFYVDGQSKPSWFGTGSEDYFGYAWGSPDLFNHAYHGQSRCDERTTYGRTSLSRFHIMDRVPFDESFRFDMEIWHWKECKVNLAVTTYWYARPGGTSDYKTLTKDDLIVRPMPPYFAPHVAGAIEGEKMKVLDNDPRAGTQDIADLSGDQQFFWRGDIKDGEHITIAFDAPTAGKFKVIGRFVKARDYGIVKLVLNGEAFAKTVDLFNPDVVPSDEIELGTATINAGENKLTITNAGKNEKAIEGRFFGLDYLRLEPEK